MNEIVEQVKAEFNRLNAPTTKQFEISLGETVIQRRVQQLVVGSKTVITLTTGGNHPIVEDRVSIRSSDVPRAATLEDIALLKSIPSPAIKVPEPEPPPKKRFRLFG